MRETHTASASKGTAQGEKLPPHGVGSSKRILSLNL